jgi:hypothetical protein
VSASPRLIDAAPPFACIAPLMLTELGAVAVMFPVTANPSAESFPSVSAPAFWKFAGTLMLLLAPVMETP